MRRLPLWLVLAACSGTRAPLDHPRFCEALWDALAVRGAACLGGSAALWRADLATERLARCAEAQRQVDTGRVQYRDANAAACLSAIGAASCNREIFGWEALPECQATLVGAVPEGAACWISRECLPGHFCTAFEPTCAGTCVAYRKKDETCGGGDFCDPALTCTGGFCADRRLAGAGEACGPGVNEDKCHPDLYCRDAGRICVARPLAGQPCPQLDACNAGTQCLDGTCVAFKGPDQPCAPGGCGALTYCGATGACVAYGSVGGPCGTLGNGEFAGCLDSWCGSSGIGDSLCVAYNAVGQACDPGVDPDVFPQCGPAAYCTAGGGGGSCVAVCQTP